MFSTKVNTRNGQQHISKQYVGIIFIHGYDYKRTNQKPKIYCLLHHTSHRKEFGSPYFLSLFVMPATQGNFAPLFFLCLWLSQQRSKVMKLPLFFLVFFVTTATTGNEAPPFCFPLYGSLQQPPIFVFSFATRATWGFFCPPPPLPLPLPPAFFCSLCHNGKGRFFFLYKGLLELITNCC